MKNYSIDDAEHDSFLRWHGILQEVKKRREILIFFLISFLVINDGDGWKQDGNLKLIQSVSAT